MSSFSDIDKKYCLTKIKDNRYKMSLSLQNLFERDEQYVIATAPTMASYSLEARIYSLSTYLNQVDRLSNSFRYSRSRFSFTSYCTDAVAKSYAIRALIKEDNRYSVSRVMRKLYSIRIVENIRTIEDNVVIPDSFLPFIAHYKSNEKTRKIAIRRSGLGYVIICLDSAKLIQHVLKTTDESLFEPFISKFEKCCNDSTLPPLPVA